MKNKFEAYNKEVMKHFLNPKHSGKIENPDAIGKINNDSCLLPEENIFLNNEFEEIWKSKKEDYVLSHNGFKNKIVNKLSRKYNGRIITLKNNMGKISLTPEHLIFAMKVPDEDKYHRIKSKKQLIPAWYHAEQLKKRDIVLFPIPKDEKDIDSIEINIPVNNGRYKGKEIPKKILLSSDLLRLFGYFIAEGNVQDGKCNTLISFTLNIKEEDIIKDIKRITKKIFGIEVKIRRYPKRNTAVVYIYNSKIARFFKRLFGNGAEHKKFPEFIMHLPIEKQKSLIYGLWKGDGHINLDRISPRAGYATISYQLAQQIKLLLLRQKIALSIYIEKEKEVKVVKHKKAYRIHIGQMSSLSRISNILGMKYYPKSYISVDSWFDDNFLYTPITKIEKIDYNGEVYNLEVENSHSFISEGFCLHNCGDLMEVYLKINKKNNKIEDIKFQTLGCGAAIASSDVLCELAKGKTLNEAKKIDNKDIIKKLHGLPSIKMHCSVLGARTLRKAIDDYEKKKKT